MPSFTEVSIARAAAKRLRRKGPRKMARAFLERPHYKLELVRDYKVSPATVHKRIQEWAEAGIVAECEAPDVLRPFVRSDADWYAPTPFGRMVFEFALGERARGAVAKVVTT